MKNKVNQLYLLASIMILGFLLYQGGRDIYKESIKAGKFNRAHETLENDKSLKLNYSPKLSLDENRELITQESRNRINRPEVSLKRGHPIDEICFDSEGNKNECTWKLYTDAEIEQMTKQEMFAAVARKVSSTSRAYLIKDFEPGQVYKAIFFTVLNLVLAAACLYGLKLWVKWLIKIEKP
jgi:hypothetical protein